MGPRESSNLLRQFEEERYHTRDTRTGKKINVSPDPQHQHESQFSLLTSKKSHKNGNSHKAQVINTNTCDSHTSTWSFASSAASFDYHAGNTFENKTESKQRSRNGSSNRVNPSKLPVVEEADYGILQNNEKGIRIPPEGAPSEPENHNHKQNTKLPKLSGGDAVDDVGNNSKEIGKKNQEGIKNIIESSENDGELLNLRKLLKEGRIAGLNEKPPSFKPPSPPTKASNKPNNKKQKAPSPKPPNQAKDDKKDAKVQSKKNEKRLAPKPPDDDFKPPPPSNEVKFLGGRRVHSVENIHSDSKGHISRDPRREQPSDALKRSTSMHSPKEYAGKSKPAKDSVAQLIADSTEKKFKFNNLFKGIWKKKQYSFDM